MKPKRLRPPKHEPHSEYHRLWRVIDGAIKDCFTKHPDYLTPKGNRLARLSLVKRVAGQLAYRFPEKSGKAGPG